MSAIHPDTSIGAVTLTVRDLDRAVTFYQEGLGFRFHGRQGDVVMLGAGERDLLVLRGQPDARPASRRHTGLYHFAILTPSRRHLARSLRHLIDSGVRPQGFADHLVSEAVYLADPEGNGIEIYRDRPRDEWAYEDGVVQIDTVALDVQGVLDELRGDEEPWTGLDGRTTIGHIHLQVADLDETEAFYRDALGFDLVTRYGPSASFFSAGGYHHHIGSNLWHSANSGPPPAGSTGLDHYEIRLPDDEALAATVERLRAAGHDAHARDDGHFLRDPAGIGVLLTAG